MFKYYCTYTDYYEFDDYTITHMLNDFKDYCRHYEVEYNEENFKEYLLQTIIEDYTPDESVVHGDNIEEFIKYIKTQKEKNAEKDIIKYRISQLEKQIEELKKKL